LRCSSPSSKGNETLSHLTPERKIKCYKRKRGCGALILKVVFRAVMGRMELRQLAGSQLFSKLVAESFLPYSHQTGFTDLFSSSG